MRARQANLVGLWQRRGVGAHESRASDLPLLEHQLEHVLPSRRCAARIRRGVVQGGIRGDPGEQGSLRQGELLRAALEVRPRGLLDTIGPVPEVDGVQVRREDAILRPALLELPGESGLAHFACECLLVPDVRVLHELLRDRRASLDDSLVLDVLHESTGDAFEVDPVVLEEALILDRDDRLTHDRRDVGRADEHAALVTTENGQDRSSVRCIDDRIHVRVLGCRVEGGDLARDCAHETERERQHRQDYENAEQSCKAPLANTAPLARRPLLSPNPQEGQV